VAGLRRAFGDGVWLVQLDQLRDQALMPQAVAGALGLPGRAGVLEAVLAEYLADRQLLMVLDNCEHLVDTVAKLADLPLRAAAGLRVLATSRESLNIAAETALLSPEQIDARLGDRLGLLTWGSRTKPARQQRLRASIDWSYK
jgi:non-specific serine/threonine protein kinase